MKKPAVLILTGASGVGKTTLLQEISAKNIPGVKCIHVDNLNIPPLPKGADSYAVHEFVTMYWLKNELENNSEISLAIVDTQIRIHHAQEILAREGIQHFEIILIDCDPDIRDARLEQERGQSELVNHQMNSWGAYLRGQADALKAPVIDNSTNTLEQSIELIMSYINQLLKKQ